MVMLAKQAGARLVLLKANNKCTDWAEGPGYFVQTRSWLSNLKGQFSQEGLMPAGNLSFPSPSSREGRGQRLCKLVVIQHLLQGTRRVGART